MEDSMVIALTSLTAWLASFAVGVIKAREWVEGVALTAMRSGEGREIVHSILSEKHTTIEDKLDTLTANLETVADRLEMHIEVLSQRMESKLDRLHKDTHDLDVRLSVIEGGQARQ